MKTITVALVIAALAACSKDKAKTATTTPNNAGGSGEVSSDQVKDDAPVSPNLAISSDILTACGITAVNTSSPHFDYDKDDLTPEDRTILDQIATCLTTGPLAGKSVSLIGRADPRGTEEYNLGLGSRRAQSVMEYLARLGVGAPQLAVSTRGALDASGTSDASWAQDRRVDVQMRR